MTIHVNIGEAKSQLSKLIAAAKRGETVIINRDGQPEVELKPVASASAHEKIVAERRAFFGSLKGLMPDVDFDALPLFTEEELKKMESPDF